MWIFDRCGGNDCTNSKIAPIQKFDASGRLLVAFGSGMINYPHGLHVDADGNVWATDNRGTPARDGRPGKGHVVWKFAPDGRVLMTLGKPGVAGNANDTFNAPSDVITNANGDIFVADGHGDMTNARIVKFDKTGKFIKAWGTPGSGQGQFNEPHGLAMDSQGRLFVADRANNRVSKTYTAHHGQATALLETSLVLAKSEFVCIVGPSGCGKTTLLNMLAGFVNPSTGSVQLNGVPVSEPGPERGVVFQEVGLFPWLTVQANVEFGLKMSGVSRRERQVRSVLDGGADGKTARSAALSRGSEESLSAAHMRSMHKARMSAL